MTFGTVLAFGTNCTNWFFSLGLGCLAAPPVPATWLIFTSLARRLIMEFGGNNIPRGLIVTIYTNGDLPDSTIGLSAS